MTEQEQPLRVLLIPFRRQGPNMIDRVGYVPTCPNCGKLDWLECAYVFHAASGQIVRELWQCSGPNVYVGWGGCGWTGPRPSRVNAKVVGEQVEVAATKVEQFTEAQRTLQESGDVMLVIESDGSKSVVF